MATRRIMNAVGGHGKTSRLKKTISGRVNKVINAYLSILKWVLITFLVVIYVISSSREMIVCIVFSKGIVIHHEGFALLVGTSYNKE